MKRTWIILLTFLILLLLYAFKLLHSTGYFREIKPQKNGSLLATIDLPGAEDMTLLVDEGRLLVSSDDRMAKQLNENYEGGLYLVDLKGIPFEPKCISKELPQPFHPHGISILKVDSAKYQLVVINHVNGEHRIESFLLLGDSLIHQKTYKDKSMISPNDLVLVAPNRFYFTNDHGSSSKWGKLAEDYLSMGNGGVVYFDGENFTTVETGIDYANGINYDPKRDLLFVASAKGFKIKVYNKAIDGALKFIEDIPLETGPDNIEFDSHGSLVIGCHPNLMAFANYAKLNTNDSPSEVIEIRYRAKADYSITSIFVDDGELIPASSVAVRHKNMLVIGNVMHHSFLILSTESSN